MSAPLYELVAAHRELQRLAEEAEIDPQAITDTLEGLEGDIEVKCQSVAMVIRNLEEDAKKIEQAAKLMQQRAQRLEERSAGIKAYLLLNMQATGITKISCPYFTITRRANPPRVDVTNEAMIPDAFRVWPEPPPPSLDKRKILDALKRGDDVPGAVLAQGERLEIKV